MKVPQITEMIGSLSDLAVDEGDDVVKGQMICQIESMKTMFPLYATVAGRVEFVVDLGEIVAQGDVVAFIVTES